MSNSITQLPMFQDDKNPLPLIVAEQYNFRLQNHTLETDLMVYSIQDWIIGLTGADGQKAVQMLREFKKQLRSQPTYFKRPSVGANGKTYQMDFAEDTTLYQFAAYARATSDRPQISEIKDFLAKAGAIVDAIRQDPESAQEAIVSHRQRKAIVSGKSEAWITARELGIQARNHCTAAIMAANPNTSIAETTNTTYKNVLGQDAAGLRQALHIGPRQNPRDNMSLVALSYLQVTEASIATTLEGYADSDFVSVEDVRKVVAIVSKTTGAQAQDMARVIGIDLVTGQKRLNP